MKTAADRSRQRSRKIIDEKREKSRAKSGSLQNTLTDPKGATFVIFKSYASTHVRKERLSPVSKARMETSQNRFAEKRGMPN